MKFLTLIYKNSLIRFLFVGSIGLLTDVSVLYSLRHEIGLILAKIISYIIAYTVTWILNRDFTFHSKNPHKIQEWLKYSFTYAITGGLHVLLFAALVHEFLFFHQHPIWPLLITAAVMAIFNFTISKQFVFKVGATPHGRPRVGT